MAGSDAAMGGVEQDGAKRLRTEEEDVQIVDRRAREEGLDEGQARF